STKLSTISTPKSSSTQLAYVSVPSIIAVPGEITTVQACRITPQGDWLYVSLSVYYNQTSHVIEKFHYNQTVEKLDLVDRFSVVTSMSYDDIIVNMTLNLTAPTIDICSLDYLYNVSCSVTMDDVVKSEWANSSHIIITAPPANISIEIEPSYISGSVGGDTINCTAIMNPYTTTLSPIIFLNEMYEVVPRNITQTFIGPMVANDCTYQIRVMLSATFDNFNGSFMACMAKDIALGHEYFSKREPIIIVNEQV
ncbi:uncharacterized protein LOC134262891, partial [Saccostrea cucullata]|uniref:uncharacterized protein LOC134262891 n=1 Tax=Saccostrea cuccullata TaxID=36930 RepID=UPI002ED1DC0D